MELLPPINQIVSGDNRLKPLRLQDARFDKLQQPGLVFGSASLESDGRKMLGAKDDISADGITIDDAIHLHLIKGAENFCNFHEARRRNLKIVQLIL